MCSCGTGDPEDIFFFNYSEDDDSFHAAVSRGWNKHFPEITRKRERTPTGAGAGIESSSSSEQNWAKLRGGGTYLGSSGGSQQ